MKIQTKILTLIFTSLVAACGTKKETNIQVMDNNSSMESKIVAVNPPHKFFTASGENYSYHMEINFDGSISFIGSTPSLALNINEKLPGALQSTIADGFMYIVNDQNDLKLTVHVFEESCEGSKKKARIVVSNRTGEVVLDESACGSYHSGINLGGLWILHEVNGTDAGSYLKSDTPPRMEITVQGNGYHGTFGCRKFGGNYDVNQQKLFTAIRQAPNFECIESPEESEFIKIFGDQEFNFQFKNNFLIWRNEGNEIIFKRID